MNKVRRFGFRGCNRWGALLGIALITAACADDKDAVAETEGDTEAATDSSDPTATDSATTMPPTTSPGTTTADSTTADPSDSTSGTGMDDAGFINMDTGDTGTSEPQPNGSQCGANEECESGFCYTVPQLGGVCSECLVDQDCETGTCSISPNSGYAVCTDGGIGNMCNTDEGCMGDLVCAELLDTGGLVNSNFCSECNTTADCEGEQICSPVYDLGNFAGYLACVDPMSVETNGGCPIDNGVGDGSVCVDGHCGVADIMGFIQLGVCGECTDDGDCMGQETCTPPSAGQDGLFGAVCE